MAMHRVTLVSRLHRASHLAAEADAGDVVTRVHFKRQW